MTSTRLLALLLIATFTFASTDSRGCWTCAPGWTHWYELGFSEPTNGDPCECVITHIPSDCWTCASDWIHWYELGLKAPTNGDRCQCIHRSSPIATNAVTSAPIKNCWTCAPGYSHWYELGLSSSTNGDKCQCIHVGSTASTAKAPHTNRVTTTTTRAPAATTRAPGTTTKAPMSTSPSTSTRAPATTTTTTKAPAPVTTTKAPATSAPSTATPSSAMKLFLDAMTPSATSTGSASFSPGVAPYSPSNPPPLALVSQLMDKLIASTKYRTVLMYYIDPYSIELAAQKGLKVVGIVYTVPGQDNSNLIETAISVTRQYPDTIISLACGNEMGANYGLTDAVVSTVRQCVTSLRNAKLNKPIGSIDTYYSWCSRSEKPCNKWSAVGDLVDWVGMNDYPWYDNTFSGTWPCVTHAQAAQVTLDKHRTVSSLYGKPVVLTEFGWPSAPEGTSINSPVNVITGARCGIANAANQKTMIQNTIDLYRMNNLPCNTFEVFKESWKGDGETHVETQFGFCSGTAPYTCVGQPN